MRITNRMITSRYMRNTNAMAADLDRLNTQVTSGRRFMRGSEDPAAAVKAYRLREDLGKTEGYKSNMGHAKSYLASAESLLLNVQGTLVTAREKIIQGINSPQSSEEKAIIAKELRNIQGQLLQSLNSNDSGFYLFGGSNTENKPFSVDADGKLVYNEYKDLNGDPRALSDLMLTEPKDATGNIIKDPNNPLRMQYEADTEYLANAKGDSLYTDIGLRPEFIGNEVVRSTVFSYSLSGTMLMTGGSSKVTAADGTDMNISNNLHDLLGQVASELESGTMFNSSKADALLGAFVDSSQIVVTNLTDLGARSAYLTFSEARMDTMTTNMEEKQLKLEGADPARTIIDFKAQQVAYQAALKMGAQIIQPSIFDYMR